MVQHRPSTPAFISMALLAIVTAVLIGFGITEYAREKGRYYEELNNKINETTSQLAASLALPIWNYQDSQTAKIVENAFFNEDISAVLVIDALSNRIVEGKIRTAEGIIPTLQLPDTPGLILSSHLITLNDRVLGEIKIQGSTTIADKLAKQSLLRIVSTTILLDFIIFFLLNYILKKHISIPLKHIEHFARTVSMGDQTATAPPHDTFLEEMNSLKNSIVIMVERLQQQYHAQMEAQHKLDDAEIRYRDLYENAPIGIFRTNIEGKILTANAALASILGYSSPEILIRSVANVIDDVCANKQERQTLMENLHKQDQLSGYKLLFKNAEGEIRVGSLGIRTTQDSDGNPIYRDGILHDITKRDLAEEKLREAHKFIQEILDSMPSIVIGIDSTLHITHCNMSAQTKTGLTANQLLGNTLTAALPRMALYTDDIISAVLEQKTVTLRNRPYTENGITRQENILAFPVLSGGVKGGVIRIDDTTEQARLEELILQTEKMMSVGGLAAGMAHEINNPLAGILLGVQNIMRRLSPELATNITTAQTCNCELPSIHAYMETRGITKLLNGIKDSGERAARIVSNMLSFARQSQSNHTYTRLDLLLDKCIELAATDYDLKKKYDFKQIVINREYAPDSPEVVCSPPEIEQVILNLLKNAAQSIFNTPPIGVTPQVTIRLYKKDNSAIIEVEDNGPGVREQFKRQIFEPFFTTKQPGEGTGLGLSVSYFIITRNHNGKIWLDSESGSGAKFCIQLPITTGTSESSQQPETEETSVNSDTP